MGLRVQHRRDTDANWAASASVPSQGELCWSTDGEILKMGDGVNTWPNLIQIYPAVEKTNLSVTFALTALSGQPATGDITDFYQVSSTLAPVDATAATLTTQWSVLNGGSTWNDGLFTVGASDAGKYVATFGATITQNQNRDLHTAILLNGGVDFIGGSDQPVNTDNGEVITKEYNLVAGNTLSFQVAHQNTNTRNYVGHMQIRRIF